MRRLSRHYLPNDGKLIRKLFTSFILFLLTTKVHAQNACPLANATLDVRCPASTVFMGTQTDVGSTYTWYKAGVIKDGPLAGDGTAVSFGFNINTVTEGGQYTIEKTKNGVTTCVLNTNVVFTDPPLVQTFNGGGILCSGAKVLSLASTQANTTYSLLRNSSETGATVQGTGSAVNFSTVFEAGVYSVSAFNNDCQDSKTFFGNAVVIDELPGVSINSTTTTTANLSWTGSGNYIIEYGAAGFTPGSAAAAGAGGTIVTGSTFPVTLSGLTIGKSYDIYIRQLCAAGVYNSSLVRNFVTNCATVTSFPYTQGFEGVSEPTLPLCVKKYDNNSDGNTWGTSSTYAKSGTLSGYLQSDYSIPSHDDYLILPPMTLTGTQRLKYWIKVPNPGNPQVYQVKLSTTNNLISSFNTILLTDTATSNTFQEKIVNLGNAGSTVYIAICVTPVSPTAKEIYVDDITVENIPLCPGPAFAEVNFTTSSTANISWNGTGTFIVEYGATNFVPGTGASAGAGGTIINNAISPLTIPGLTLGTKYDVYIRQNCSANGFSPNSPKLTLTTFLNCATATNINACANVAVNAPAGAGVADFSGVYPNNSVGTSTAGKEVLYTFTPATTGVYYIDVSALSGGLSYLYKPASAGCSNADWIGIANVSATGKYAVGMLQSGSQYYILLDNPGGVAITHTFKICLATVGAPSLVNSCINSINTQLLPDHSPKIEYLIDNLGNLIAGLDFSNVAYPVGKASLTYFVNTNAVRYDSTRKEYLDRNYIITTTTPPVGNIGVTLYFTNNELTRLINEPNDGIADVNSAADLKITANEDVCGAPGSGSVASLFSQTANGAYDANSKYVQFVTPVISNFYLHGGTASLFGDKIICPGTNVSFAMQNQGAGFTYQWQVDNGSGFVNIVNSSVYKGALTNQLDLSYPPDNFSGLKYRCVATKGATVIISDIQTLKFVMSWTGNYDNSWENSDNWSCHSTPDANMDIFIPANVTRFPVVKSNVSCKSMTVRPGATLTISSGFKLTITGK